jgi:hypothetical protein
MTSLSEALLNAGLVNTQEHEREQALKELKREEDVRENLASLCQASPKGSWIEDLANCHTVNELRRAAIVLLARQPECAGDVLKEAHRLKELPGGKKLVWQMYQIRDNLQAVAEQDRERFLKRALRRAGSTLKEPTA